MERKTNRTFFCGHAEEGVTLIETIISVVILLLIIIALHGLFSKGLFSWVRGDQRARAVQIARLALNGELTNPQNPGIIQELRQSDTIPGTVPGAPGSGVLKSDALSFHKSDTMGTAVIYEYQPGDPTGNILRTDSEGNSEIIADCILDPDGLQFTYYDKDDDPLDPLDSAFDPDDIYRIRVEVRVDINGNQEEDAAMTASVIPRTRLY
ncbi:MAG: hypothetical protein QME81_00435 [bacterium]|nr:hypothetical protein [bacterium]